MTSLLTLALVLLMLASATLIGCTVLRWVGATPAATDRVLFGVVLGLAVQSTLLLLLASLGWMHPVVLWGAVIVPGALAIREHKCFDAARRELTALLVAADPVERIVATVVAVAVMVILVFGALGPITDWDSLMYHVQLPRLFLQEGRLHLPPDGLHVAYLGSIQFLYLPLMALGAAQGAALLNALMAVGLGLSVTVAGTRLFNRSAGLVGGVALWGSSSLLLVAMTPRVDVSLIFAVFLAHYAVLLALRDEAPWGPVVAALIAGVAIGIKYHSIPYVVGLVPFALWALWRENRSAMPRRALVAALAALMVASPWLIKNQVLFGAPLYPFFAERVMPPFIAEIQGTHTHPAGVPEEVHEALGLAREPITLKALLFRPTALTIEGEAALYTRNPAVYLAPLALLFARDRLILALLVPGAFYLLITLGLFSRTNLRYLMPVLPVMILLATESVRRLGARLPSALFVRRALIVVAALVTIPALRVAGTRALNPIRVQVVLGLAPPEAVLNGEVQYLVAKWFNDETPPESRVLMLFDAQGYYHERETIQDNVITNWALLVGTNATENCLAGTGITHVYLNRSTLRYYQSRGVDLTTLAWHRFPEFAARCLTPLLNNAGIEIYAVR